MDPTYIYTLLVMFVSGVASYQHSMYHGMNADLLSDIMKLREKIMKHRQVMSLMKGGGSLPNYDLRDILMPRPTTSVKKPRRKSVKKSSSATKNVAVVQKNLGQNIPAPSTTKVTMKKAKKSRGKKTKPTQSSAVSNTQASFGQANTFYGEGPSTIMDPMFSGIEPQSPIMNPYSMGRPLMTSKQQMKEILCSETPSEFRTHCSPTKVCRHSMQCVRGRCCAKSMAQAEFLDELP